MRTRLLIPATLLASVALVPTTWAQEAALSDTPPAPAVSTESKVAVTQSKDTLSVDFPDEEIRNVLRNVADLGAMFRELARVLAPGGRVALLDLVPVPEPPPWTRAARIHLRYVVPRLGTLLAGDATAYTYLPTSVETIPLLPDMERLLAASGFANVRHRLFGLGTVALLTGTRR